MLFYFSAIIQSIIGFLVVILRFALVFLLRSLIGGIIEIAVGAPIFVAGAPGIVSYKDPKNHCKNGFHMVFSILACCASSGGIGLFSVAVK